MKFISGNLLSILTATIVFIFVFFAVDLPFWISALFGLFAYGVGLFLFGALNRKEEGISISLSGLTQIDIEKAIRSSGEKVANIRNAAKMITNKTVASKVYEVCAAAEAIIENFKKDPKDIKAGRQFINYYLDAAGKIVERYVELSTVKAPSREIVLAIQKAEEILSIIKEAFEKQLSMLMEDQVMDLNTEMELLKKTLKMEGFK